MKSFTITLEEPYELLIYCSRYGCDWRLRDPRTKRFLYAPDQVFFICHKKAGFETRKGMHKVKLELEMQGVCVVERRNIRELDNIDEVNDIFARAEAQCMSCELVSRCIQDQLLDYAISEAVVEDISYSYTLSFDTCYVHIEEEYNYHFYQREYEGGVVEC